MMTSRAERPERMPIETLIAWPSIRLPGHQRARLLAPDRTLFPPIEPEHQHQTVGERHAGKHSDNGSCTAQAVLYASLCPGADRDHFRCLAGLLLSAAGRTDETA